MVAGVAPPIAVLVVVARREIDRLLLFEALIPVGEIALLRSGGEAKAGEGDTLSSTPWGERSSAVPRVRPSLRAS